MSNPAKPVWPDPAALPFPLSGNAAPPAFGQPFAQGLAGGVDFMKKLWGQMPGNSAVPGFLLPTLDIDELDKRISDLKAAESWLEVNLNLLRATVQGLEVQRHTIAAIRSFGAVTETPQSPKAAASAFPTPSGLPPGWPVAQASAGERSAEARPVHRAAASTHPASATVERSEAENGQGHPGEDAGAAIEPSPSVAKKAARPSRGSSSAPVPETPMATPASALAGLAANHWLGYMQEQFAKVAQAALASSEVVRPQKDADKPTRTARANAASKAASKPASSTTSRRRSVASKKAIAR